MNSLTLEYGVWLNDLKPRTCLLVHWLSDLGALPVPCPLVRERARRFAQKRSLLGRLIEEQEEAGRKAGWLLDNEEFETYVAWLMWLRFVEYVPQRFVLPQGRERVLKWVREQLGRPELTGSETVGELQWHAERLGESLEREEIWRGWQ